MRAVLVYTVVVLAILVVGIAAAEEETPRPHFPDVVFTTLDGQSSMTMSEFRGRPVLVTFWASWCGPCRVELPELSTLYGELIGRGFVLITVNVDHNPMAGRRFLDALGLSLPVYRLNPRDTKAIGVDALPTNILLDPDGRFVKAYKGYTPAMVDDVRRLVLDMTTDES